MYRCILERGILIGSEDEVWSGAPTVSSAVLETFRNCIEAVGRIVSAGYAVTVTAVQAVVNHHIVIGPATAPYLDDVSEFVVDDSECRRYWDTTVTDDRYPVRCPLCKRAAAFVGMNSVECKSKCVPSSSRF